MKKAIREQLEQRRKELDMAEPTVTLSQEQFQELLKAVSGNRMNPLEEKKYNEEMLREKNKELFKQYAASGDVEAAKKKNCTHTRHPMSMGKLGGHAAPRGQGEMTTGAQIHSDGTASVVCQRCSATWTFKPTPDEVAYIIDGGGSSMVPPDLNWPGVSPRLIHEAKN